MPEPNPEHTQRPVEAAPSSPVEPTHLLEARDGSATNLSGVFSGTKLFLIAGGPSFGALDQTLLKSPGILTMGLNNSPKTFRPNLWVSVDSPHRFLQSIWLDPTILKFCRQESADKPLFDSISWSPVKTIPRECPAVFFFRSNQQFTPETYLTEPTVNWGNDSTRGGARSVLLAALKLCFYLGIREVFLLGVDFQMEGSKPYHFSEQRTQSMVDSNNEIYRTLNRRFERLLPHFEQADFRVWNCNPDSRLTAFPFLHYEEAIERASAGFPKFLDQEESSGLYQEIPQGNSSIDREVDRASPQRSSSAVRRIDRSKRPSLVLAEEIQTDEVAPESGVVVLADTETEWLLPWWIHHYRKSNPNLPFSVADGGITDQARSFLDHEEVTRYAFSHPQELKGWFRKPFAIAGSPFRRTVFSDLDCEIRGSLSPMLSWCQHGIVLGPDLHPMGKYRKLFRPGLFFNSGLVGTTSDSQVIPAWGKETVQLHEVVRGDQEILNLVLYETEASIVQLPPLFHRLRLDGDHPDAVVMHWTGAPGKNHIRCAIETLGIFPLS